MVGPATSVAGPSGVVQLVASPNPFRTHTQLFFDLANAGDARVRVFDAAGRLVRVLGSGDMDRGPQVLAWDGRDSAGRSVAAGVYYCRLESGGMERTSKLVLVR